MKLKYNIDDKIKLINIDEKTDFSLVLLFVYQKNLRYNKESKLVY